MTRLTIERAIQDAIAALADCTQVDPDVEHNLNAALVALRHKRWAPAPIPQPFVLDVEITEDHYDD